MVVGGWTAESLREMKIGLALSGGGVRATMFHLGVLARLAETPLWGQLAHISTVSGGSLCIALVFVKAGKKWPSADEYLNTCLPEIRRVLTTFDLQKAYKRNTFTHPWLLSRGRARVIAKLIEKHWGVTGNIANMPREPRWTINATCYETGKNWRFAAKRMGDYEANYVIEPKFPLADAVAASAAFPGLIGPLVLHTGKYQWHKYEGDNLVPAEPIAKSLVLWDGGVYDNLGVEALYKLGKGFREGIDFCLVSDASGKFAAEERGDSEVSWLVKMWRAGNRLVAIPMDQVRGLRARDMFAFFKENSCGGIIRMGESVQTVFNNNKCCPPDDAQLANSLTSEQVQAAATFSTCLSALHPEEYDLLFRHGYETCGAVLACRQGGKGNLDP